MLTLWTSAAVAASYLLSLLLPSPAQTVAGVVALLAIAAWTVPLLRRRHPIKSGPQARHSAAR